MFKILVVFLGLLNGSPHNPYIATDPIFSDMSSCTEALYTEPVLKDVITFTNYLKQLGYTDLSFVKYECISEDTKL